MNRAKLKFLLIPAILGVISFAVFGIVGAYAGTEIVIEKNENAPQVTQAPSQPQNNNTPQNTGNNEISSNESTVTPNPTETPNSGHSGGTDTISTPPSQQQDTQNNPCN